MHCVMVMMAVMDHFLMMDGFMRLGHRYSCHSHEDHDRHKELFHV